VISSGLAESLSEFDNSQHVDILGVRVSAVSLPNALAQADTAISGGKSGYICVTGVHGVMEAQRDLQFRKILNEALINAPDGMPMSWVGWANGFRAMDRVYGPDFMLAFCELSVGRGYRHFLLGGRPGVAPALQNVLQSRFPGLNVVGTYTPPFRPLTSEEEKDLFAHVRNAKPHVIWVGLSTPKQEKFMAMYVTRFGVPLMVGVGAAFDLHTGQFRDAPNWVKRCGLQWLHRLVQEPRRLAPRYLYNNPRFVFLISCQLVRSGLKKLKARSYRWLIPGRDKASRPVFRGEANETNG
jgi:N-acetylglucosaminyldiphosphoundecaprenol N-acetyl-beta-D-mannosaminyltransferase